MHFHKSLFLCCAFRLPTCAYPTRESISEPVPPRVCGTGPPSGGLRSAHRKLHARHRLHSRQTQTSSLIAVDTYVHFVTTDDQAPFYNANVISTLIGNQVISSLNFPCLFLPILHYIFRPFSLISLSPCHKKHNWLKRTQLPFTGRSSQHSLRPG